MTKMKMKMRMKIMKMKMRMTMKINENEVEDEDEIIKILMSSFGDYDDDEVNNRIKKINDHLDKIIDKSKSFEDQIKSIKKVENLNEFYFINGYDHKELEFKIFKLKFAHLSNIIDKNLFKQIFGHTFIKLADKLINTKNKEENQIILNKITKNKDKIYKEKETSDGYEYVIQSSDKRNDFVDATNLILQFNFTF